MRPPYFHAPLWWQEQWKWYQHEAHYALSPFITFPDWTLEIDELDIDCFILLLLLLLLFE